MKSLAAYGFFLGRLLRSMFYRQLPPSAGQEVPEGAREGFSFAGLAALREVFPMLVNAACRLFSGHRTQNGQGGIWTG